MTTKIFINTRDYVITGEEISYEVLCKLTGKDPKFQPSVSIGKLGKKEKTLLPGDSIPIEDGYIANVMYIEAIYNKIYYREKNMTTEEKLERLFTPKLNAAIL